MTLRQRILSAIMLALLAICAALYVLPARWIMVMVPDGWPLAVVDASGTIWSGNATVAIGAQEQQRTLPAAIRSSGSSNP